jgi:hypothetical protein
MARLHFRLRGGTDVTLDTDLLDLADEDEATQIALELAEILLDLSIKNEIGAEVEDEPAPPPTIH